MSETPRLQWASENDHPALLALFQRAFDASMPASEWAWKYPAAGGLSLVALRGGQAVAHYGGQPRRMLAMGELLTAVQVSDIMVDPNERGALGRGGLFARIATAFTEQVTQPVGAHAFVFGFPSPRATRLGELLGIYGRLDRLEQLTWPARPGQSTHRSIGESEIEALVPLGEALWPLQRRALADKHLMGIRDDNWLAERYASHPLTPYRALVYHSRWRRRPLAAAVFREHADHLELLDLLGAPRHYGELVAALCGEAARLGHQTLLAWLTPGAQAGLPAPRTREPLLHVNLAGPGHKALCSRFHSRCWMTAGDTDYR